MKTRSRFSKGQMAVLLTLVLPVLLGAMCLGADFAIIYLNWAMIQKAADAAALAGASQLTGVLGSASSLTPAVVNYVDGYACMNGVSDPSSVSTGAVACTQTAKSPGFVDKIAFTNVTDTQVSVGIKRSVPYFFGKMIGLQEASVAATATAAIEATGGAPNFPVGLQCTPTGPGNKCDRNSLFNAVGNNVTFGSKFVLNDNNNNMQSSGGAPGNWDWIDVGQGQGASGLGTALAGGISGSLSFGQDISTSPGVGKGNGAPVQQGLNKRLSSCNTTASDFPDPCGAGNGSVPAQYCKDPCVISVPVMDFTNCNGNCTRPIEGFALMYLEQGSTISAISACFVNAQSCTGTGSPGAPNLGSLAPPVLIN
jgi:Flp pilus assembly protein TadG